MGYGQWSTNGYGTTLRQSREEMARNAKVKQRRFTFGDHANTCHVWAQQNPETWRGQSSDGRIRFEGATIYSYGSHFPMANFTARKYDGQRIVLINGSSYSTSTGKHKSPVRNALTGLDVYMVTAPDLSKLLGYHSGKELRAMKREVFDNACEHYARAYRDTEAGRHWATSPRDARAEVEALKIALNIERAIPGDILQWSDDRAAKFEAMVQARRLRQAKGLVSAMPDGFEVNEKFDPDRPEAADYNAWNCRDMVNQIEYRLREIGSARLTLGKAKRFPGMVRKASAALKAGRVIRDKWLALQGKAAIAEARDADLENLAQLRGWINAVNQDDCPQPKALWNYETAARLWSTAIRENMPDLAEYLGRYVQIAKWKQEVPATYKVEHYGHKPVTPDEWRAGKGECYSWSLSVQDGVTLLRKHGDELQTSQGARCPWPHAVKAFEVAQLCRIKGEEFIPNGHTIKVGTYKIDRIDVDGTLHAGCHHLDYTEMQRLAIETIPERVRPRYPLPAPVLLPTDHPLIDFDPRDGREYA